MNPRVPCRPHRQEQLIPIIFNKSDVLFERAVPPWRHINSDTPPSSRRSIRRPLSRSRFKTRSFVVLYGQAYQRNIRVPSPTGNRTLPQRKGLSQPQTLPDDGRVWKGTPSDPLPQHHPRIHEGRGELGCYGPFLLLEFQLLGFITRKTHPSVF